MQRIAIITGPGLREQPVWWGARCELVAMCRSQYSDLSRGKLCKPGNRWEDFLEEACFSWVFRFLQTLAVLVQPMLQLRALMPQADK